jgi:hypothetical protein
LVSNVVEGSADSRPEQVADGGNIAGKKHNEEWPPLGAGQGLATSS